ncbi:hypothetical protein A3E45_02260 [Candidatus Daviesbacteria bacterium RIFCSPHIGHO2_12_FULL_43_11]|uniref:Uncharacterized protein n=1 Tax=Candidatus Daviesbacteria bacterium RIFCSPHIGHO2_12_FULL_43_11 TaxID=1797780 RepID=A0A1F5K0G3_9BACT|nr:MAG: hypothetical protein A3E45_02260 [Candidatus Daviesbacteria bacterium RIFCSPHIGHO2_12_FULL_43_11]
MSAIGAKYKWKEGKILHASRLWKAPSKRRIPRILIEDRVKEVGVKVSLAEPWMIFEETNLKSSEIVTDEAVELEFYLGRYYLLPEKFSRQDTYEWLKKGNILLLWAVENKYFVREFEG